MELIQYPQEALNSQIAREILALERTAWPSDGENEAFPSAPESYVSSFVWLDQGRAVCHVGIRKSPLLHRGESYLAYGLSEVVTHPDHQNRGLASQAIRQAAAFIASAPCDLSLFTCAPKRVPLYTRGGWAALPGSFLVGGTRARPFYSSRLGLVTMALFLSPKAKKHRKDFEHTDIFLELGEGRLW